MGEQVHDGHRQRMRERIIKSGISTLQDHEVLEYLLYSFIPRKDTNEIAHALINKFGSLAGVLNANEANLSQVSGMTKNASLFLSSLPDVFRAYISNMNSAKVSLKGRGIARDFMGGKLYGAREENVLVAALDAQDQLIHCEKLATGSGNSVALNVRAVVNFALSHNACSVLIAHNHPSGNLQPSQNDIDMTKELFMTLSGVGITLQDHFIFCDNQYYSFEEQGKLQKIKNANKNLKEGMMYYE